MELHEPQIARALTFISGCDDAAKLQQLIVNATAKGQHKVRHAAELRLYDVLPAAKPGTLEYDVWRSVYALEGALKVERGKTVLLARTRQKIARDGEHKTVADLVLGKVSDGFKMLIDREMPQLTFEAVALKHATEFDDDVIEAAVTRLREAGLEPEKLV